MKTILLDDFVDGGIIREKSLRKKVAEIDFEQYRNQKVIIKGCADVVIPTWDYLILTANLAQVAEKLYYGEPRYAVKIFNRKELQS